MRKWEERKSAKDFSAARDILKEGKSFHNLVKKRRTKISARLKI
jgi:hypothetical protein